jgi:DNA invertase Pin-like site-specific DNA recombinase
MTKRVALYHRVSKNDQTVENQRRELEAAAKRHGWQVVAIFEDEGISGAKGRDKRPGFDGLCRGISRRDFDLVAVWSVDRLGRSLSGLVEFLSEVHAKGCDLYVHLQGLDTSTPTGKAMFQLSGVFAEFERSMIVSRVRSGLARAKENPRSPDRLARLKDGKIKQLGFGRPKIDPTKEAKVRTALAKGDRGMLKVAAECGVGSGTVQRIKAEMQAAAA